MRGPLDKRAGLELHIYTWRSFSSSVLAVPEMPRRMRELHSTTKRPKTAAERRGNEKIFDSLGLLCDSSGLFPFVNITFPHWDAT